MASIPNLDPNDPINILLMPFDPMPKAAAANASGDDAQASQGAPDAAAAAAAAAAAEEAERQRKIAEEKANILRSTVGGKGNATQFGGAEGEVVYESNVRPSGRRWEPSNRVETKRTVVDFNMSDPLPPSQIASNQSREASFSPLSSPVSFSQPIQVQMAAAPAAAAPIAAAARPPAQPRPIRAVASPSPKPRAAAATAPPAAPAAAAEPAHFSPTAGVHPTNNKTEELMAKMGGSAKVRQCPSFRMLEFQIQYEDYKQTKTAVS